MINKNVALFLITFGICMNQSLKAQDHLIFNVSLDHVALSVKDVDASAKFYEEVLYLREIENRGKVDGIRWFAFADNKELHLISTIKGKVRINKAVHFAVTLYNYNLFIEDLENAKIPYYSWDGELNKITNRADGVRQVYLQDPDGYWIEVNSVSQDYVPEEISLEKVIENLIRDKDHAFLKTLEPYPWDIMEISGSPEIYEAIIKYSDNRWEMLDKVPDNTLKPESPGDSFKIIKASIEDLKNGRANGLPDEYREMIEQYPHGFSYTIYGVQFLNEDGSIQKTRTAFIYVNDRWIIIPRMFKAFD